MENLKKNFEEPVVQIINMCFCENIATSGATACPASKDAPDPSGNQTCEICKVIYHCEKTTTNLKSENISDFDYIKSQPSIIDYLKGASDKKNLGQQIAQVAATLTCPVYKM